jgi:hypothetical protein
MPGTRLAARRRHSPGQAIGALSVILDDARASRERWPS